MQQQQQQQSEAGTTEAESTTTPHGDVDMDQVYDDVLRLAYEFNCRLQSFTSATSCGFIVWLALLLYALVSENATAFSGVLTAPLVLLIPLLFGCGDGAWRALTGENILRHCTSTAFCSALCSMRPLRIGVLAQKECGLWPQLVEVSRQATKVAATVDGRRVYALNRLLTESIRQGALSSDYC